jgi:hypothetical protein
MASLPANPARYSDPVGTLPFHYIFGTFVHPLDPINREIQAIRLKALVDTYPEAEGYFLVFPELYPKLDLPKHRAFFEEKRVSGSVATGNARSGSRHLSILLGGF